MELRPVLVVDDEEDLLNLIDMNLRREGFRTLKCGLGKEALELAAREKPSIIILDLMLPDLSGTEVCRRLRKSPDTRDIPIIMLTARGEEIDRVIGFEVGADDYVVKTAFSMRELILRVRAVLRRRGALEDSEEEEEALEEVFGDLRVDHNAHRVWVDREEIELTATEFKLLTELCTRSGRVLSRGRLLERVWDMPADLNTRTVDTHVKRLREKLGKESGWIETVRGVGYRFKKPHA